MNTLGMIALVIDDYDVAISHYVNDLGFTLIEDTVLSPEKRWVVVAPSSQGARVLLAKAANEAQVAAIGNSTGGRVGFFMYTTNFNETYKNYSSKGIEFIETPRQEEYGQVVVFKDKYGNKWDLLSYLPSPPGTYPLSPYHPLAFLVYRINERRHELWRFVPTQSLAQISDEPLGSQRRQHLPGGKPHSLDRLAIPHHQLPRIVIPLQSRASVHDVPRPRPVDVAVNGNDIVPHGR